MNINELVLSSVKEKIFKSRYGEYSSNAVKYRYIIDILVLASITAGILTTIPLIISTILYFDNRNDLYLLIFLIISVFVLLYFFVDKYKNSIFTIKKFAIEDIKNKNYQVYKLIEQTMEGNFYKIILKNGNEKIEGYVTRKLEKEDNIILSTKNSNVIVNENNLYIRKGIINNCLDNVEKSILEIAIKIVDDKELNVLDSLCGQGVDSLEYFQIIMEIEEKYNIEIPYDFLTDESDSIREITLKIEDILSRKEKGC